MKACLVSSMYTWQPVYAAAVEPDDGCFKVQVKRYEKKLPCLLDGMNMTAAHRRLRSEAEALVRRKYPSRTVYFGYFCDNK